MKLSSLTPGTWYLLLAILLLVSIVAALRIGAVDLTFDDINQILLNGMGLSNASVDPISQGLFLQIRLPRVLLCATVGAGLSVSGVLMQALFRNPIVEPGLVGTSSGAALGAALVFVLGKNINWAFTDALGLFLLPCVAFIFAFFATLLVYRIASVSGKVNVATMILAGIAINALATGGTGFLSYIARDPQARSITFWNLGTFSGADWTQFAIVLPVTLLGILLALRFTKALNVLILGEDEVRHLGYNIDRLKIQVLLLNTLLVAIGTAMVGVISFVGLVVPHLLRLLKTSDNRFLVIASALLGGSLLTLADTLARRLVAPAEFPIGVITAFVGAPVFIWLLMRNARSFQKGGFYA
ncbi:iron ABC transporter permease [Spirosoma sp. SC4-14]|uniref:FecCD family ABC transporter permease n=1 Tax=Spirosoma sp. SC4-14 TaxID=3128900 RepID=UPI0030CB6FAC